jgi:hypothetical protein
MIRKALPAYLLSKSEITDLVGQRVYPAREPQRDMTHGDASGDVYPCIVFRKLSRRAGRQYGNTGPAGDNTAWMQIESVARTYAAAQAVGQAVLGVMESLSEVAAGVSMASAELRDDWDEVDAEVGGDDEAIFAAVQVFEVLYADPAE